jgi:hypothetical protein
MRAGFFSLTLLTLALLPASQARAGVACATDCSELDTACKRGVCNIESGQCGTTPRPDATPCDDAVACNGSDVCISGLCIGHQGDQCLAGPPCRNRCQIASGQCRVAPGTPCNDGSACTTDETCNANQQCTGTEKTCPVGTVCEPTDGSCNAPDSCEQDEDCDPICQACAEDGTCVQRCGDSSGGPGITATDALGVLQAAVALISCPVCVCDVNSDSNVTASDALAVLRRAVGLQQELNCPLNAAT